MSNYLSDIKTKIIVDGYGAIAPQRQTLKINNSTWIDDPLNEVTVLSVTAATTSSTLIDVLGNGNSAGGSKITNLGSPVADYDAANKLYIDTEVYLKNLSDTLISGNTTGGSNIVFTGGSQLVDGKLGTTLDANNHLISNLSPGIAITDAATVLQTQKNLNQVLQNGNNAMGVSIEMSGAKITGLGNPVDGYDAANKNYVDSINEGYDISYIYNNQKDPTGFPDRTTSVVSVDNGTRTFSIAPVGVSYEYLFFGKKVLKSAPDSIVFSNVEGLHFIYFNSLGVLQETIAPSMEELIINNVFVAAVYWDVTNQQAIMIADERHGLMDARTHLHLHNSIGTQWYSGGTLGAFTILPLATAGSLPAHAQFDLNTIVYADEDIIFTITDGSPQDISPILRCPIFYRSGTGVWRKKNTDAYPLIYSGTAGYTGASGRIPWNRLNAGVWDLLEVTEGNYVLMHYFGTNNKDEPIVGIQGQAEYTTQALAQSGATQEMNNLMGTSGLLGPEFVQIGTVIYRSGSAYSNIPKAKVVLTGDGGNYVDFRGKASGPGSGVSISEHSNLTGLNHDDHLQYLTLTAGPSRALTSNLYMSGWGVVDTSFIQAPVSNFLLLKAVGANSINMGIDTTLLSKEYLGYSLIYPRTTINTADIPTNGQSRNIVQGKTTTYCRSKSGAFNVQCDQGYNF